MVWILIRVLLELFLADTNPQVFLQIINQILPMCYHDFIHNDFCEKFHEKILNSDNLDYIYSTITTLGIIMKYMPQYFIEKQQKSSQFNRIFDLINLSFQHKTNKPEIFASLFFVFYNTIDLVKSNRNFYTQDFFANRNYVIRFLEYVSNDSSSSQYLSKALILNTIGSYYKMLSLYENNYDLLVSELIDLIKTHKPIELKLLFQTLKEICQISNRIDILIENKNFFSSFKQEVDLSEIINSILDLCDGRSLQVIDSKLEKNVENLNIDFIHNCTLDKLIHF